MLTVTCYLSTFMWENPFGINCFKRFHIICEPNYVIHRHFLGIHSLPGFLRSLPLCASLYHPPSLSLSSQLCLNFPFPVLLPLSFSNSVYASFSHSAHSCLSRSSPFVYFSPNYSCKMKKIVRKKMKNSLNSAKS